jgi:hypothetical protein
MRLATTVHDLKTLVLSYHPIVVIETAEEERARRLLAAVAAGLGLPLFEWSVARGLRRVGAASGASIAGTGDALGVLRHLATLTVDVMVHLVDFTPDLDRPAVERAFRARAAGRFVPVR